MRHASLFSGIGGFDLAAQWMGWENVFQVEKDEFCQKVLTKNFQHVKRYGDIKEFDGTKYRGTIDILTGGFPCQPYSLAGKRKGKDDDRHLWPENLRIIREIRPSFVLGENVYGLVNWNEGMVFDEVQANLEAEGYQVAPVILPACGINAPHRRQRVWFVAYRDGVQGDIPVFQRRQDQARDSNINGFGHSGIVTHANGQGLEIGELESNGSELSAFIGGDYKWQDWPIKSGVCRTDDGIPNRVDRIATLGNAIVPQVAFQIFKAIESTFSLT